MAKPKKKTKTGKSRKSRSPKQRAATKRMLAANRAARGGRAPMRQLGAGAGYKKPRAKRGAKKGSRKSSGGGVTRAEFHRHVAGDTQWKRKQAVINTILVGEVKGLANHTGFRMSPGLRSLPVGPSGPARRLGSGR